MKFIEKQLLLCKNIKEGLNLTTGGKDNEDMAFDLEELCGYSTGKEVKKGSLSQSINFDSFLCSNIALELRIHW